MLRIVLPSQRPTITTSSVHKLSTDERRHDRFESSDGTGCNEIRRTH